MTAEMKLPDVFLGLAAQAFKFMAADKFAKQLEKMGIRQHDFAERLVKVLQHLISIIVLLTFQNKNTFYDWFAMKWMAREVSHIILDLFSIFEKVLIMVG